jgi:hypothetical protein
MKSRNALFALIGLAVGLLAASRIPLHAQKPPQEVARAAPAVAAADGLKPSLQEALVRPYNFDFTRPTTLEEVARRLSADLGGEVVLDIAALDRLDVKKDDTVELALKSARLKTGLKLLLDQVDMTYRTVPEDNLLILTDVEGSEDPLDRVWSELTSMHRELHDVQDALDDLFDLQESGGGLQFRQPTIIEELPAPGTGLPPSGDDADSPEAAPAPSPSRRPRT